MTATAEQVSSSTPSRVPPRRSRGRRHHGVGRATSLLLFAIPALAIYAFAVVVPSVRGAFLAFTNWDGLSPTFDVIGFDNFVRIFTTESSLSALNMTLVFALAITIPQSCGGLL